MKAVVKIAGKQYIVSEKRPLMVDLLPEGTKELELDILMVIDGDKSKVGAPLVKGVQVKAKVLEGKVAGKKLRVIRYKAKKRVHKEIGHRQSTLKLKLLQSNN